MSNLPTIANFILCEDIREEAKNKITLLGVFSGDEIALTIENEKTPLLMPSFAVYSVFKDGVGEFKAQVEIKAETGEVLLPKSKEFDVKEKEHESMVVNLKLSPITFPKDGIYEVTIYLDKKPYVYAFKVLKIISG